MAEAIEPAKNRTSCDLCKRMKIRCEKQGDRCAHCISRDAECVVTIVPRKKRQKKTDYLSTLEDRLLKMEAVITAASTSSSLPASASASQTPEDVDDHDYDNQAALSEKLESLYIGPSGESKYVGSSSGFSLFSQQGLEWITKKTGGTQFSDLVQHMGKVHHKEGGIFSGPSIWYPLASHEQREPFPTADVAKIYTNCFFNTFNVVCPLFDQGRFEEEYARQPAPSHEDVSWYAALNMVMAIGSLISSSLRGTEDLLLNDPRRDASEMVCWKYFRNASSLYIDLTFKEGNLMAVRAMIAMALMMQSMSDPQPAYMCTAAAVRLAHSVGLHRKMAFTGLSESEMEQRSNVFWSLYTLEQGQSLRSGRPSMIQDDDIGIDLPKPAFENDQDTLGNTHIMGTFPKTVELSHLSSRVYSGLYSAKSQAQSRLERLRLVGHFDKELEQWRDSLPIEIRPGEPILCEQKLVVPVIMLQFQYYFLLTTIHRVSVHHGYWMNERAQEDTQWANDAQLNPRVFASGALCLSAARNTIRLFQHHNLQMNPFSDTNNLLRMADYFPLTALLTLFANCLQHPQDENAPSDIDLMTGVVSILARSMTFKSDKETHAVKIFEEIMRLAQLFVNRARSQERHKRTHERLESKEDKPQMSHTSLRGLSATAEPFTPAASTIGSGGYTSSDNTSSIMLPTATANSIASHPDMQHPEPYSYSPAQPLVSFDPSNPLPDPQLSNHGFDGFTSPDTNINSIINPPNDMNAWWPGAHNPAMQQAPNSYIPFDPNLDDQDLLLGWDPNVFLPMNMTFQWDLADLWTGKGKGATAE